MVECRKFPAHMMYERLEEIECKKFPAHMMLSVGNFLHMIFERVIE